MKKIEFSKFQLGAFSFLNYEGPFITQKNVVYGTQMTGLSLRFQRKNWFWKKCIESWDISQNAQNFTDLVWRSEFGLILANISGLVAYFSKQIFALKPWVQAGRFEYHEPYKLNEFFLTYKGSFRIIKRKSTQLEFWKFYFFNGSLFYI